MTRWNNNIIIGVVAIAASACAQTSEVATRTAYVPRGQAAQPGSWISGDTEATHVAANTRYVPRGQAAQPSSWNRSDSERAEVVASNGKPAGQAAQPGWAEDEAAATHSAVAAGSPAQAPAWRARAQ